jgi:hypothetical protein
MKHAIFMSLSILIILGFSATCCGLFEGVFTRISATPTLEILYDCFINFNLSAWIDSNVNGVWDESEEPLADVAFHIDGNFASVLSAYPCISDEAGQCILRIWYPGMCVAGNYEITPIAPETYKATTPEPINLFLEANEFSGEAEFGFISFSNE